jgi:IS5 family transposase
MAQGVKTPVYVNEVRDDQQGVETRVAFSSMLRQRNGRRFRGGKLCRGLGTKASHLPRWKNKSVLAACQGYPRQLALEATRARETTEAFKKQYAHRAEIEGTISLGVCTFDLRRARYLGLAKTHLQHILVACVINLTRLA